MVPRTDLVMGRQRVMVLGGYRVMVLGRCLAMGHRRMVGRRRVVGHAAAGPGEHHPILEARCGRGDRRDELMPTATRDRVAKKHARHGCTS
jgi:hypothetical protein